MICNEAFVVARRFAVKQHVILVTKLIKGIEGFRLWVLNVLTNKFRRT